MKKPKSSFIVAFWGGFSPGWRVEFQLRRSILRDFGIETVDDLLAKAGGFWEYLTTKWMSLRLNDDANTCRRAVHPLWKQVQDCASTFGPDCAIQRIQKRLPDLPADWYITRMSSHLLAFASRLGLKTIDAALAEFDIKAREHWGLKSWDDLYARKRIEFGRIEEGGSDDLPI